MNMNLRYVVVEKMGSYTRYVLRTDSNEGNLVDDPMKATLFFSMRAAIGFADAYSPGRKATNNSIEIWVDKVNVPANIHHPW